MWPVHLMHTALSGTALVTGARKYASVVEFIDTSSDWEKAGAFGLGIAFGAGVYLLWREARKAYARRQRRRNGGRRGKSGSRTARPADNVVNMPRLTDGAGESIGARHA